MPIVDTHQQPLPAELEPRRELTPVRVDREQAGVPERRARAAQVTPLPSASSDAERFPASWSCSVRGPVRGSAGGEPSVNPCSTPSGPFTYHSTSAPRL